MGIEESVERVERELKKLNLGKTIAKGDSINLLDIGIKQNEENLDRITEYLIDITDKKININLLNYEDFIKNMIGMSFEEYVQNVNNILTETKFDEKKAIDFTKNLLDSNKEKVPEGGYWINNSVSQSLLQMKNTKKYDDLQKIHAMRLLHPLITNHLKNEGKEVSLLEVGGINTLCPRKTTEHYDAIKDVYIQQNISPETLFKRYTDILEYFLSRVGSIRHVVGSSQNEEFLKFLNKEYSKETQQSMFSKKFGFISNKLEDSKGKLDIIRTKKIDEVDLSEYAALFIDNSYDFYERKENFRSKLGQGINVLQKINKMKLEEAPIIFYQTAHNLEHISDEDKEKVENLAGAILLPKNVAPKFSFEENMAQKEIEISRLLSQYEELFQYTSQTLQMNDSKPFIREVDGEKYFITLSKSALVQKINEEKKLHTLKENNLDNNTLNSKMYVLSMFHEALKTETNNPVFQQKNVDFFEYEEIKEKILPSLAQNLEQYEKTYNEIVEKHKKHEATTISHNDTKWDNWFGQVLGDYGQASIGTEYKDIARSLLERETLENNKIVTKKTIDKAIDAYTTLRKNNTENFDVNINDFRQNVYEMVFVESLRLARYESIQNSEKLTEGLLTNARYMHNLLTNNFEQHAKLIGTIEQNNKFGEENLDLKLDFLHDCLANNLDAATPKLKRIMQTSSGNPKLKKEITETYQDLKSYNTAQANDQYNQTLTKIRDLILPK